AHEEDSLVRPRYLGLIKRRGNAEQKAGAIRDVTEWLARHDADVEVRKAWLGFVEAVGSNELKTSTIASTKVWLTEHPFAKEVWGSFLGWLFRLGRSDEAYELAVTAVSENPSSQNLLEQYVRLVQQQDSADPQVVRRISEQLIA